MQPALPFDYEALDADTRATVQRRTDKIRGLMRRAAQDIVDIGLELIGVKEDLPHGAFGPWLRAEFEWDIRQAQRFMAVAERFGECDNLSLMAPSALYLLAAPSTPEAARAEALALAESGEPITYGRAQEIVQNHQPPPDPRQLTFPPAGADPEEGKEELEEALAVAEEEAEQDLAAWESGPEDPEDPEEEEPVEDAAPCRPPLPVPPPIPTRAGSWPHSERLARWLKAVSSQTHVINIELGGIAAMLGEREKWDWRDVREFILPMLAALAATVEEFRTEIQAHANEQKGR
jgi:hypothetical protein